MHEIEVFPTGFVCSCGKQAETPTGAEAQRLAYKHAQDNTPSVIKDKRRSADDIV